MAATGFLTLISAIYDSKEILQFKYELNRYFDNMVKIRVIKHLNSILETYLKCRQASKIEFYAKIIKL